MCQALPVEDFIAAGMFRPVDALTAQVEVSVEGERGVACLESRKVMHIGQVFWSAVRVWSSQMFLEWRMVLYVSGVLLSFFATVVKCRIEERKQTSEHFMLFADSVHGRNLRVEK